VRHEVGLGGIGFFRKAPADDEFGHVSSRRSAKPCIGAACLARFWWEVLRLNSGRHPRSARAISISVRRFSQFASGTAPDRIGQARLLLALHPDADLDYLERRIRQETMGDHGIESIKG
jgi:hypothetical protein